MLAQQYGTFTQIQHLFIDGERRQVFHQSIHNEIALTAYRAKNFLLFIRQSRQSINKGSFLRLSLAAR